MEVYIGAQFVEVFSPSSSGSQAGQHGRGIAERKVPVTCHALGSRVQGAARKGDTSFQGMPIVAPPLDSKSALIPT